jgi:DNA polymerase-3 subunit alpha
MGAIKGVGKNAVETIVENRKKDGEYKSVFDLAKRIDLRAANKKAFESLALAGAFDNLGEVHRAQFFHQDDGSDQIFLEKIIKYAARYQENKNSAQVSLFGDSSEVQIPEPVVPPCEPWHNMKTLKAEKEVVGLFLSAHPLDDFRFEMKHYCNANLKVFKNIENYVNKELKVAGVITDVNHRVSKNGKGFATFIVEDYYDTHEFWIFGEDYLKNRHYLIPDHFVHLKIRPTQYINRDTGEPGRIRTQYLSFKQLQDVIPEFSKRLKLMLDIEKVDETIIENLSEVCQKYKGSKTVDVVLYDKTDEIKLNTHSKSKQVEINSHLLAELKKMNLNYKLN